VDYREFFIQFQDYLAPKLDAYEQAIYLYIFRHSRLLGLEEVTIGFKSARNRMACGIGEKGKPMSENTAYIKLASLHSNHSHRAGIKITLTKRNTGRDSRSNTRDDVGARRNGFFHCP
jgi:hypothetical protein